MLLASSFKILRVFEMNISLAFYLFSKCVSISWGPRLKFTQVLYIALLSSLKHHPRAPTSMISSLRRPILRLPDITSNLSSTSSRLKYCAYTMATKQTLQSKHKLLSGHEIPIMGFGVSNWPAHLKTKVIE